MTLAELQERMASAILRPLTASGNIAPRTPDGRLMRSEAAAYIQPNDRLSALERLQIYNRQYWFRILDAFGEDFPGLRAILGARAFNRLATAYIAQRPSESFTLRDLGSRLEAWLRQNPQYAGRRLRPALDMVRLEWAHIVAFDGASREVLGPEDLLELEGSLRLGLQPYISLLDLSYPVDELRIGSDAPIGRLKPAGTHCAVHRWDFTVYYRRLTPEEYRLLSAIRAGHTLSEAIDIAFERSPLAVDEIRNRLQTWFATWAELGWFCKPG